MDAILRAQLEGAAAAGGGAAAAARALQDDAKANAKAFDADKFVKSVTGGAGVEVKKPFKATKADQDAYERTRINIQLFCKLSVSVLTVEKRCFS